MLRRTPVLLALSALLLPATTLAQEATTTRIETRAFYGATVTLEAGVRVFRPLPPHSKVIINPGGTTPLYLGHEEHRSTNYNYNYDRSSNESDGRGYDNGYGGTYYGGGFAAGRRAFHHGQRPQRAGVGGNRAMHVSGRPSVGSINRGGGNHAGGGFQGGGGKR